MPRPSKICWYTLYECTYLESRHTFHAKLIYWSLCRIRRSPISVTTFDNCFIYDLEIGNLCEFSCLFGAPLLSLLKLCCFYYTFKDCNWSKASWSNLFELHPQKKSWCIVCDRSHCTNRDMIHCSCVLFTKNCVQFLALKRRFIMYHMTAAECSKAYVSQCIICFFFLTQKNHVERRKKSDRYLPCHIFGAKIQTFWLM